jgi:hypothetical protein
MGTRRRRQADRAGRPPMRSPGRPPVGRREHKQRFWDAIACGLSSEEAGVSAGCRLRLESAGSESMAGWHRSLSLRRCRRATCRSSNETRSPCFVPVIAGPGDRAAVGPVPVDDLAGAVPQRGDPRGPSGVPGHDRTVARRPPGQAPKAPQARHQRRPAQLRAGSARGGGHCRGRHPYPGPGGALDRAAPRTPIGPPLGGVVESGADRQPAPGRFPR